MINNINKWIAYFAIILMSMVNISCEKYLDAKPDLRLATPTTVIALQALLDHSTTMNERTPSFDEVSADDYFLTTANFNSLGEGSRAAYTWQPFNRINEGGWRNIAQAIYIANVSLEEAAKITRSSKNSVDLDNIIGSAYFFRGYHWLKMVITHSKAYDKETATSDLGMVLRLTSDFNVPSIRSTLEESYKQIIQDLELSISYLPEIPSSKLRPSKAAAHAALARTYLSMREYEKAEKHSSEALKISNKLIDFSTLNVNSNFPFLKFNDEVIFHTDVTVYSFFSIPVSSSIDSNLYTKYHNNDLRKTAYFAKSGNYYRFKGTFSGNNSLFNGISTSEVYLTKAECLVRLGQTQAALDILNKVMLNRWNVKSFYQRYETSDSSKALEWILLERRKDLIFKGLRWMDVKRLNKENHKISIKRVVDGKEYILEANDDKFALPLPKDIIDITDIKQNPGW